jgi:hypothetical protein
MTAKRMFKKDTVMVGDKAFSGTEGAQNHLDRIGMNMNVRDYLEFVQDTDITTQRDLDAKGIDVTDETTISNLIYTPGNNSINVVGADGAIVPVKLPPTWEAAYGRNPQERANLERFKIKAKFAPVIANSFNTKNPLASEPIADELRKEYNVRGKTAVQQGIMLRATVIAQAAGLSPEATEKYLDEVYKAAQGTAMKHRGNIMGSNTVGTSDATRKYVDDALYNIPDAPPGFTKELVQRYFELVGSTLMSGPAVTDSQ